MGSEPTAFDIELGRKLKNARLALGLTQAAVAQAIGVAAQQVQKYENGRNRISASRLTQLGAALNIDFSRTVNPGGARFVSFEFAPDELRLIESFSTLNVSQKALVQSLVDELSKGSCQSKLITG